MTLLDPRKFSLQDDVEGLQDRLLSQIDQNIALRDKLTDAKVFLGIIANRFPCIGPTLCHVDLNCLPCFTQAFLKGLEDGNKSAPNSKTLGENPSPSEKTA